MEEGISCFASSHMLPFQSFTVLHFLLFVHFCQRARACGFFYFGLSTMKDNDNQSLCLPVLPEMIKTA